MSDTDEVTQLRAEVDLHPEAFVVAAPDSGPDVAEEGK